MIEVHQTLNPDIWEGDYMRPEVRAKLIDIASVFLGDLGIPLEVDDIILTGSMANFNYTAQSDLDLHVVYDPSQQSYDKLILTELFLAKKTVFNEHHRLCIKGHPVELYVQDATEIHTSTGVFSIMTDQWVKEPVAGDVPEIDDACVLAKADELKLQIDNAEGDEVALDAVKARIKAMRVAGLATGGEYSVENLAFKNLRNTGYIEKLILAARAAMDAKLSIESIIASLKESPDMLRAEHDGEAYAANWSESDAHVFFIWPGEGLSDALGAVSERAGTMHSYLETDIKDEGGFGGEDVRCFGGTIKDIQARNAVRKGVLAGRMFLSIDTISFWDTREEVLPYMELVVEMLWAYGINPVKALYEFSNNPIAQPGKTKYDPPWMRLFTHDEALHGSNDGAEAPKDYAERSAKARELHTMDPIAKSVQRQAGRTPPPVPPTPRQLGGYDTMAQRNAARLGEGGIVDILLPKP